MKVRYLLVGNKQLKLVDIFILAKESYCGMALTLESDYLASFFSSASLSESFMDYLGTMSTSLLNIPP